MIAYTYLIGWSKHNRWYYGSQYGKKAHPSNLWNTYFTSSKEVKKFRKEFGEPDVVEVRKVFVDVESCRVWEYKVIKRMKIVEKESWFNKSDGNKSFFVVPGTTKRKESTKKKQSQKTKEYWNSLEGLSKKKRLIEKNKAKSEVKGKVWINDGNSNKLVWPDKIPEGWKRGKLFYIWITNGIINKRVTPNEIPDGFRRGRANVSWFKPTPNTNRDRNTGRFI